LRQGQVQDLLPLSWLKSKKAWLVSDLKEIIKKKVELDIPENQLILWKVNINIDDNMA
jgi:hypothetical protein